MGCKQKCHFILFCFESCNFILKFLVSLFPTINLKLKSLYLIQSPLSAFGSSQTVSVSSQSPLLFLLRVHEVLVLLPPVVDYLDLVDVHDTGADNAGDALEFCKDYITIALFCWGHNCSTTASP